jgi:hypothetical protein
MEANAQAQASRVIISREDQELVVRNPQATVATLLAAVGVAFAVVGIVDLALLWYPLGFGNASWEFGTLSRTFDNVPMSGLGVVLVAAGVLLHPSVRPSWIRAGAIIFGCAALLMISLAVVYATAVPAVIQDAPPEVMGALKRAVVKNGVQILAYTIMFAAAAALLWRTVRVKRRPPARKSAAEAERRSR